MRKIIDLIANNFYKRELDGCLKKLSTNQIIDVKYMKIDKPSEEELIKNANRDIIKFGIQNLYIEKMCIKKSDADIFINGQSPWIRKDNAHSLSSQSFGRRRFKAEMNGFTAVDETLYMIKINAEPIEFDVANNPGKDLGELVLFENVPAMICPNGFCRIEIYEDESDE